MCIRCAGTGCVIRYVIKQVGKLLELFIVRASSIMLLVLYGVVCVCV